MVWGPRGAGDTCEAGNSPGKCQLLLRFGSVSLVGNMGYLVVYAPFHRHLGQCISILGPKI